MCQFCEENGLVHPERPPHVFDQGRFSGRVHSMNKPEPKDGGQAQGHAASGEQIDEASMSSAGRDLLGMLRVSEAFGSTSEFTPVTVRFIAVCYGATPDDITTIQRYLQTMKPAKAPASADPGETIAQAVMTLLGLGG